jgi:hypothetical protein
MKTKISDGNKIIAEFMGSIVQGNLTCKPYPKDIPNWAFTSYDFDTLKISGYEYNKSWDWLMPVWERISKIKSKKISIEEMEICREKCWIKVLSIPYKKNTSFSSLNVVANNECKTLIESVYKSIIEFIKWHNEQK